MKRQSILLISIIMLFFTNMIFSQNPDSLDKKNGFKEFKLGDSYSKWSSKLKYINTISSGEKRYVYIGTCCQEVFTTSVEEIQLLFAKDKLVLISIDLKPYQDFRKENKPAAFTYPNTNYQKLVNNFVSLFGASQKKVSPDEGSGIYYIDVWKGKKVTLYTYYIFQASYDYSSIIVMDKTYFDKKKSSGF